MGKHKALCLTQNKKYRSCHIIVLRISFSVGVLRPFPLKCILGVLVGVSSNINNQLKSKKGKRNNNRKLEPG